MRTITIKTKEFKGWTARIAMIGDVSEIEAGEGIMIENGRISVAPAGIEAGSYANPIVTVDGVGRIIGIEEGTIPGLASPVVLADVVALQAYTGDAEAVFVLDAGDGRSAIYVKDESNEFQGPAYLTGPSGRNGTDGTNGVDGATGPQGARGEAGERGADGLQGARGPQGEQGATGAAGANGAQGPQGLEGPRGPMGAFLTPNEYGNLDEDAIARIGATQAGKDYFFLVNPNGDLRANKATPSGISGDMSLHLIGKNASGAWQDYGQLTGAQGPQGNQGPQGPQGERGPAGVAGATGPQGVAGAEGARGIQGIQGPAGVAGERGIQGVQGERGLTGAQGPAGVQGVQGPSGPAGQAGEKGAKGDSYSYRGVMYTVATTGGRVAANTAFQPVPVPLLVYNVGGLDFRPQGTADNVLVVPQGVSFIRISAGIGFINNNVVVDSAFHFTVYKNGLLAFPGSPSLVGKFPYTNSRFSIASGVLSVVPGDAFSLIFATSTPAGQKTPTEHTFFSMEVVG